MKVYAYFDSCCVSETAKRTLDLWKKSWENNGWDPVILTENDARLHPFYTRFSEVIRTFPSVNGPGFDYHAFMRWLAVANRQRDEFIVTTEPDVINYDLAPEDVEKYHARLDIHSPVPAFITGSAPEFELFCAHVLTHLLTSEDVFEGRPHLSDQDFAARYAEPRGLVNFVSGSRYCREVFADGWETAPCVHFGTPYMLSRNFMPKHEHIPSLRPL